MNFFLSCCFQYLLLVFSFSSLSKLCLDMDLFMFILLEICWLSWFCRVMFLSIVRCFQPLFIQIIFLPLYGTLISHSLVHLMLSCRSLLIFLYSFFLSVLHFPLIYLQGKFTEALVSYQIWCWTHLVIFFVIVIVLFNSRITIWFFL